MWLSKWFSSERGTIDLTKIDDDIWENVAPDQMLEVQRRRNANRIPRATATPTDVVQASTVTTTPSSWWESLLSIFSTTAEPVPQTDEVYLEAKVEQTLPNR